jgi:glutathionylspermidine synthase
VSSAATAEAPWRVPPALESGEFERIRRRMLLDHCKWDPQVGDISTLAPFPLVLDPATWDRLASWAEQLTAEAMAAEREILGSPRLQRLLSIPRSVRRALEGPLTPAAARTLRYDFHLTPEGWRISEVNADVPGGFTEASSFAAMMAERYAGTAPAGDPAARWAQAVARAPGAEGPVALLSAPGFMEDHQIMAYLAGLLQGLGRRARLAGPHELCWRDGRASLDGEPLAAIVRFYQGEWLARLPARCGWRFLFSGGRTPVANPGVALLVESKRFPLAWPELATPLPAWRALLPESRDPRDAPWRTDEGWLLKTALSNNGDTVSSRRLLDARAWRKVRWEVFWRPGGWVAQRRFEPAAVETPAGPMFPCVGVYTIDGRAAGAYGRLSPFPVIDYRSVDVAVLVAEDPA